VNSTDDSEATESERAVGVWILVPSSAAGERIRVTLADRYATQHTSVELVQGAPNDVVPCIRQRVGGAPLGFVAIDEVAALEALSCGADEVMVWPALDERAIHGFFDRIRLRASLRKGQERSRASMVHAEKLSALGTLVAGIAHEINNPLMALQLSIEASMSNAANGTPRVDGRELLEEMLSASSAIASVVRDLRVFARADGDQEETRIIDTNDVVEQALRLVGREISTVGHIERDYSQALPRVVVPHGRLIQVLVNVLINAAHAINDVTREAHRVRVTTRADAEYVAISISDTGPGIASETLSHIFDPFFTTKRSGLGTGLGLSISRSLMRELGGDLIVESVHGSGATFIALVPLPDHATMRAAYLKDREVGARQPLNKRYSLLVVDEDERILKAYVRMLSSSCDVLTARDGQEAIELLSSGSCPDALVTELSLPELDGEQLFEWLRRERPQLASRTVFVSAETTREEHRQFLEETGHRALTKPVSANQLWEALASLVSPRATSAPPRA
jgi:signal transduction histidine kinase/ActR/RegA family two-component response regulator